MTDQGVFESEEFSHLHMNTSDHDIKTPEVPEKCEADVSFASSNGDGRQVYESISLSPTPKAIMEHTTGKRLSAGGMDHTTGAHIQQSSEENKKGDLSAQTMVKKKVTLQQAVD